MEVALSCRWLKKYFHLLIFTSGVSLSVFHKISVEYGKKYRVHVWSQSLPRSICRVVSHKDLLYSRATFKLLLCIFITLFDGRHHACPVVCKVKCKYKLRGRFDSSDPVVGGILMDGSREITEIRL